MTVCIQNSIVKSLHISVVTVNRTHIETAMFCYLRAPSSTRRFRHKTAQFFVCFNLIQSFFYVLRKSSAASQHLTVDLEFAHHQCCCCLAASTHRRPAERPSTSKKPTARLPTDCPGVQASAVATVLLNFPCFTTDNLTKRSACMVG